MNNEDLIESALKMSQEYGLGIIPLARGSKMPLEAGWPDKARRTPEEVKALDPEANYGVSCEGITVIDFDPRNMDLQDHEDESEVEWLIHLIREAHDLAPTLEVVTGNSGRHLYYAGETTTRKLGNGIDVKSGKSHQVVGPGSIHPKTGRAYRFWEVRDTLSPLPARLAPNSAPSSSSKGNSISFADLEREPANIPEEGFQEGDRNGGLFRHLCKMRDAGLDDQALTIYAQVANKLKVSPPLGTSEVETIIESVLKFDVGSLAMDSLRDDAIQLAAERNAERAIPEGWIDIEQLAKMPEPEYLIEGLLPRFGVGHLVGQSYGGKTFIALHLALSLAQGAKEWMGHKTSGDSHRIAYIAMEGGFDLAQRVDAWVQMYGEIPGDSLRLLVEQPFDLLSPSGSESLNYLKEYRPSVLFIDTQSLAAPTADENDNAAMTALMSMVKILSQGYGCLVILVHHAGYGGDRARGASAQFANMDVSMFVKPGKLDTDVRTFTVDKLKSGPRPAPIYFLLEESGSSVAVVQSVTTPDSLADANPDTFTMTESTQAVYDYILSLPPGRLVTKRECEEGAEVTEKKARNALKALTEGGFVSVADRPEGLNVAHGTKFYRLAPKAEQPTPGN